MTTRSRCGSRARCAQALDANTGTLAPGLIADIVALADGDPSMAQRSGDAGFLPVHVRLSACGAAAARSLPRVDIALASASSASM
jgi:cytosine/adenosine deaminase-related metal-dependent hydrolase